jgi:hypothetical protein
MANIHASIAGALLALTSQLPGQRLDDAEVRIPYGELKQLLARAEPKPPAEAPEPALLSARLLVSIENGQPVILATFRTLAFGDAPSLVPLIGGDVSLERQQPEDAAVLIEDGRLCLASDRAGTRNLELRLLPLQSSNRFTIQLPPCPSVILETGDWPADRALALQWENREETLRGGQILPLPNTGAALALQVLDQSETREALLPPEPSEWTWQQQALVMPTDGELTYQVVANAAAAGGSGVEAMLPLPSEARNVDVSGADLSLHRIVRGNNRSLGISLMWKTRGILDRQVTISYRMPLRPLDTTWQLQAPGSGDTRTRFIIASSPFLSYSAEGLSEALTPQGLPAELALALKGMTCRLLEAAATATLTATPLPVAATEEGVVHQAEWSLKVEPDGSMLTTGTMVVEHKGPLGFVFDTPPGMKLLSCELAGNPVSPVDLGAGKLKLTLPPQAESSRITCSFTRTSETLDPVAGTLRLTLPQTPLFIHSLKWCIDLPPGYQAETHGNLTRLPATGGAPSRILLAKNLCREERPEIQVFYQRTDLNR